MSTPEQPATPALTRKQLRDIRNTGATPIVNGDAAPADDQASAENGQERHDAQQTPDIVDSVPSVDEKKAEPEAEAHAPIVAAPLPRAAVPVPVHDLPGSDASVDLGVAPLTRRQARQQERIRTASVPVITPEVAAAHAASVAAAAALAGGETTEAELETAPEATADGAPAAASEETPTSGELSLAQLFGSEAEAATEDAPVAEAIVESDTAEQAAPQFADAPHSDAAHTDAPHAEAPIDAVPVAETSTGEAESMPADADASVVPADDEEQTEADRAVVRPGFGAALLAGETPQVELPPSFDQLISRSVTGSIGTGNALILSQTPSAPPLVAPVAATGEVLITGSYDLPEGLGSTGHANGTADGKETDAVLVDGELPAHSSPTPIAASAAISTVKNGGDLIKPPTPEKGGRLMLTLAITAGVLALALVGVLILAFVTGVF
jgi:hypothetical protein